MEKVKIEIEAPKEVAELAKGLSDFLAVCLTELRDGKGWETLDDLPAVASAVMMLLPALEGVTHISDEFKAAPGPCVAVLAAEISKVF
jgi:hypothetical protein